MAGSKKGERRGAAKGGGSGIDGEVIAPRRTRGVPNVATEAYMREVALMAAPGAKGRLPPREMMWEVQDYFYQQALSFKEMVEKLVERRMEATDKEVIEQLELNLRWAEGKVIELFTRATDVAFKVAPYYHPKVSPDKNTTPQSDVMEMLGLMLREIDELNRGKPTWMQPDLKLVSNQ